MILVKIYWNPLGKANIDHEVLRLCKTSCRETWSVIFCYATLSAFQAPAIQYAVTF